MDYASCPPMSPPTACFQVMPYLYFEANIASITLTTMALTAHMVFKILVGIYLVVGALGCMLHAWHWPRYVLTLTILNFAVSSCFGATNLGWAFVKSWQALPWEPAGAGTRCGA